MIKDLIERMRDPRWVKHHPEAADVIEQLWNALRSAMDIHNRRTKELEDALEDALDEWEYCSSYKGGYLQQKHRDLEQVADYRKILPKKVETANANDPIKPTNTGGDA